MPLYPEDDVDDGNANETCEHGTPYALDCAWCEEEDEAVCDDCGYPWLSCACGRDDDAFTLWDTTPMPDPHQVMRELLLKWRWPGRAIEIIRDEDGRL